MPKEVKHSEHTDIPTEKHRRPADMLRQNNHTNNSPIPDIAKRIDSLPPDSNATKRHARIFDENGMAASPQSGSRDAGSHPAQTRDNVQALDHVMNELQKEMPASHASSSMDVSHHNDKPYQEKSERVKALERVMERLKEEEFDVNPKRSGRVFPQMDVSSEPTSSKSMLETSSTQTKEISSFAQEEVLPTNLEKLAKADNLNLGQESKKYEKTSFTGIKDKIREKISSNDRSPQETGASLEAAYRDHLALVDRMNSMTTKLRADRTSMAGELTALKGEKSSFLNKMKISQLEANMRKNHEATTKLHKEFVGSMDNIAKKLIIARTNTIKEQVILRNKNLDDPEIKVKQRELDDIDDKVLKQQILWDKKKQEIPNISGSSPFDNYNQLYKAEEEVADGFPKWDEMKPDEKFFR